jgi:hypothetical protein
MLGRWTGATVFLALLVPGGVLAQVDPLPTVFWFRGSLPTAVVVHREVPEGGAVVEKLGLPPEESRVAAFTFDPSRTAVDAQPVNNLDGLGKKAIALLAADNSDVRPVIEARSVRGKALRNIPFSQGHEAIGLGILPDQNGNQSEEALVLARQVAFDRPRLLIRDLATKEKIKGITLPKSFDALDVVIAPDVSGNGFNEALVLAARKSDGRGFVLVWDTGDAGRIVQIKVDPGLTPIDFDYYRTSAGSDRVRLLLRKLNGSAKSFDFNVLTGEASRERWFGLLDPVSYTFAYVRTASGDKPVKRWVSTLLAWDTSRDQWRLAPRLFIKDDSEPLALSPLDHFAGSLRHEEMALLRDPTNGALYLSVWEAVTNERLFETSIP